jgi:hypothetical protein
MGANPPTDVSYIQNSELYGDVIFDIENVNDDNTFTFSDNDSISTLVLDVIDNTYVVKAELNGNSFADKEGAKVIIIGDYYVDAEDNVTHNGPCECDALEDFDVTHANSSSQLDLISWVYDGHMYTTDEIEIIGDIGWSFNPIACTVTVTWTTNNPSASKVYYGASCGSLNYTEYDEKETTSHEIICDITPLTPPVYFKVESWNACDTTLSDCQTGPTRGQCASP